MDADEKTALATIAIRRLRRTANDSERWSFAYRTEGAEGFIYCPWSTTIDWEFDGGVDGLELPWSADRKEKIASGNNDPTELELRQWREAKCRWAARGTDWSSPAWAVPLWIRGEIAGYALFLSEAPDPQAEPFLEGVYDTLDEAKSALLNVGALDDTPKAGAS